ncbi:RNA polymerase sigma factor [Thalassotalea euphylliae]|uniref:RNA polymerase sigma factor n=1 Tax=Thalassotalea euphylliae TaxID=1655234 RepID=UPI00363905E9
MKLPSRIKGWLSMQSSCEQLLCLYIETRDKKHIEALVNRHHRDLFHYLLSQSARETAEDIVQTVWLKVMKLQVLPDNIIVKSWLFSVARNALIDELRRQARQRTEEFNEDLAPQMSQKTFDPDSRLAKFDWALQQLSFVQREAFIFQQEGFSVVEISTITGESFETIKSRLRYAKSALKQLMS